mgnify:CR=1 FL=1
MSDWHPTACILCSINCGIEVLTDDEGRFLKVRGDKAHPSSQGYLCQKAQRLDHYQNCRDRITSPLKRRADGTFEEIGWDTAIAEIAAKLAAIDDQLAHHTLLLGQCAGLGQRLFGDAEQRIGLLSRQVAGLAHYA